MKQSQAEMHRGLDTTLRLRWASLRSDMEKESLGLYPLHASCLHPSSLLQPRQTHGLFMRKRLMEKNAGGRDAGDWDTGCDNRDGEVLKPEEAPGLWSQVNPNWLQ